MNPTVWVAVIVAGGAIVTPVLTLWMTARLARHAKDQDWERQDEVAARVEAVAENAAAVARQAALTAKVTDSKLDTIHELVNSTMTGQMAEAHDALGQQLILMREVIRLNTEAGRPASHQALAAVAAIESRVADLGAKLADRAVTDAAVKGASVEAAEAVSAGEKES